MKPLSDYRPSIQKSYRFIAQFIKENGYGPTIREIKSDGNLSSTSVAQYHRDALIKGGFVTYDEGRDRSIALAGALTLTFYGQDAQYIRDHFGESPSCELLIIGRLKQEVGVMEYGT